MLAPNGMKREGYNFQDHRANIVAALNDYAKVVDGSRPRGRGCTSTPAPRSRRATRPTPSWKPSTRRHLKFAPDVGQLQKGGANAAQVVKDFLPITVHMHLKDFSGGEHFLGYCPLGQGKVDLKGILDMVEGANPKANIMVELDGSANQPYTPLKRLRSARRTLRSLATRSGRRSQLADISNRSKTCHDTSRRRALTLAVFAGCAGLIGIGAQPAPQKTPYTTWS